MKITKIIEKLKLSFNAEKKNVSENKTLIIDLLFNSNFEKLTTTESIDLFNSVKKAFESELSERNINAEIEKEDINNYFKLNGKA